MEITGFSIKTSAEKRQQDKRYGDILGIKTGLDLGRTE
jgi:hypothetical protein